MMQQFINWKPLITPATKWELVLSYGIHRCHRKVIKYVNFCTFSHFFANFFTAYFLSENIEHKLVYLPDLYISYTSVRCVFCVKFSDRQAFALCFPNWKLSQMWRNSTKIEKIGKTSYFCTLLWPTYKVWIKVSANFKTSINLSS